MNEKVKYKYMSIYQFITMQNKIAKLVEQNEFVSASEFCRHAITWYFKHQTDYTLTAEIGVEFSSPTTICITCEQYRWLTKFLNQQIRTISYSVFIRLIEERFYKFRFNSKPVEVDFKTESIISKELVIPNYGTVKLGRGETK